MEDNSPAPKQDDPEIVALKKTTRISLDEVLSDQPAPKKATTSLIVGQAEKKATAPIMGIAAHTAPIPQTIRLKRPATSPIAITPPDITKAPTVVKIARPKITMPAIPIGETSTIVKKTILVKPPSDTSRVVLELEPEPADIRRKTAPLPAVSPGEPAPAPKTIHLKKPSITIGAAQPAEKQVAVPEIQTAKKSETAKIDLVKEPEPPAPITHHKIIKIKRADTSKIVPRTTVMPRPAGIKPQPKAAIQKEALAPAALAEDKLLPVFSIMASAAVICLVFLVYLLTAQAFGPQLILPVPAGLF